MEYRRTDKLIGASGTQVEKVENMLKRGRQYFGSSGASLTHQISNPAFKEKGIDAGLAQVGLDGERKTTKLIREWLKDKPNAILVDSVHVKGYGEEEIDEETGVIEGGDTDHVLIIGNTVIIIDSKNWKSRRRYSINANGDVVRGKGVFPGGRLNTVRARHLWYSYLKDHGVTVSAIVVISSEKVAVTRDVNWWKQSFRLVSLEELGTFLDNVWESLSEDTKSFVDVNLVSSIIISAIKPFDTYKELLGETSNLLKDLN